MSSSRAVSLRGCLMADSFEAESSDALLHAKAQIWNHTFNFINSMSLKCAVELRIPDAIHAHGKPISLSDLASALSIPPARVSCLQRLMHLLSHSGLFGRDSSGREDVYSLTTASALLCEERKLSLEPFVLWMLDNIMLTPWLHMSQWFKSESPSTPFELAHGLHIWEATAQWPEFNKLVNEGASSDARYLSKLIVRDSGHVFDGLKSLVDIGGGVGTMAQAIADAFPGMNCTVLELPHVAVTVKESERVKGVAGDMFEHVPPADAVLLKWVLDNWNHEECVRIMKRCKEAIPSREKGGKVIIIEMVLNLDGASHDLAETQLFLDVVVIPHTTGQQRTENQWNKIFKDAGFAGYKINPSLGLRSIIEVYP